jgi:Subtilase family
MPAVQNGVENFNGNYLVVEQEHAGLVLAELQKLNFSPRQADSNDSLSLTLLELPEDSFEQAIAALRQDATLVEAASRAQQAPGLNQVVLTDLDLVLFGVRQAIGDQYDHWVPAIDKDQLLDRVQGLPYIKGSVPMSVPAPAAPLTIPPAGRQVGPRVAILDTELYAHPDLAGRFQGPSAQAFGSDGSPPPDTQGHSTFIAGLIVQRAPTVDLVVRSVLDGNGQNASSWDVATKMAGVLDAEVAVLNLSLGCATNNRVAPFSLRRAVDRLLPTVVVVAAAGNNGDLGLQAAAAGLTPVSPIYPAAIDGVIGVGAYDQQDGQPASFSPDAVPWVELMAPGVGVQSTFLSGNVQRMRHGPSGELEAEDTMDFGQPGYASWEGTSFAAANVSGEIAALMVRHQLSAREALHRLRHSEAAGSDIHPAGPA